MGEGHSRSWTYCTPPLMHLTSFFLSFSLFQVNTYWKRVLCCILRRLPLVIYSFLNYIQLYARDKKKKKRNWVWPDNENNRCDLLPGVHFQSTNGSIQPALESELHSKGQIYRPVLQPSEATPQTGTPVLFHVYAWSKSPVHLQQTKRCWCNGTRGRGT